jgi:hypothetical protein
MMKNGCWKLKPLLQNNMKNKAFFLACIILLTSCQDVNQNASYQVVPDHDRYLIAPIYTDSVYFAVNEYFTDKISVDGEMFPYYQVEKTVHETYFQRFVTKEGRYRKIHAVGTAVEHIQTGLQDSIHISPFDQYVKFDELGIFDGEPADPIGLIPLYPGHLVKLHEVWTPRLPVKIGLGSGIANFRLVIDSAYTAENHDRLILVRVHFDGILLPVPTLQGAQLTIQGKGWFTWNCTINQRRDTHLSATYIARKGNNTVTQQITRTDTLITYLKYLNF